MLWCCSEEGKCLILVLYDERVEALDEFFGKVALVQHNLQTAVALQQLKVDATALTLVIFICFFPLHLLYDLLLWLIVLIGVEECRKATDLLRKFKLELITDKNEGFACNFGEMGEQSQRNADLFLILSPFD